MTDPLNEVTRAAHKAASARQEFERAIRDARKTHSVRRVAEAAGLSPARIHQIEHGQ